MNDRQATFDIIHMRNHRYDPTAFEWEQAWACGVIEAWLASCEDTTATAVGTALADAGASLIGGVMHGNHLLGAETIRGKALEHSQADAPKGDIEASTRNWRREQDPALRLNYPYYKEKDTNAHHIHFCREPAVVAAREKNAVCLQQRYTNTN